MSRKRALQPLMPPEGVTFWRAESYRLPAEGSPGWLEAERGAIWRRSTPVTSYRPAGKRRELEAGPHLSFLRLKGLLEDDSPLFDKAMMLFANEYGLLGLFHDTFSPPILPNRLWAAPEAVVGANGKLRRVDPATEGTELLLDLLDRQGYFGAEGSAFTDEKEKREAARSRVALPSEVRFVRRSYRGPWRGDPTGYNVDSTPVGWEEARGTCGGLLVLTEDTSSRVSVLCTREHTWSWWRALSDFPAGDLRPDDRRLRAFLNSRVSGVAPYSPQDEEAMDRGWRCSSLLQAMYLMLWLDLTGGSSIRKCQSRGCPNWFRSGSQPGSKYCPPEVPGKVSKCASRESSRMARDREKKIDSKGASLSTRR